MITLEAQPDEIYDIELEHSLLEANEKLARENRACSINMEPPRSISEIDRCCSMLIQQGAIFLRKFCVRFEQTVLELDVVDFVRLRFECDHVRLV